jgi:D-alanyl-lipoteichoic acid acyltransferase DltB (MBOAT superfamily)
VAQHCFPAPSGRFADPTVLFDSPIYITFLVLVVLAYWRLGWRKQNVMLLLASYFFYGWWDWRFLGLMILSTTLDFIIAQKIDASSEAGRRKALLVASLVVNFAFLGFFKYFNFFIDSLATSLAAVGFHDLPLPLLRVILPPGISFYTFQEVAYIVDVYHGKQKPARSFVDYGLFVSLFPHLIAGPIQRPSHLLGQVQRPRSFDRPMFFDGIMLIVLGLFRKCVIADNFAPLANAAFEGKLGHNAMATIIGAVAFGFQIYGDFSGYSDIARGSAQLMGFHFMVNFRQPYLADSLQDFWRRWHISLSTWLRDYLYIPLGGNRRGPARTYVNLALTMLLGGLWHGANWTFVVWGAMHGGWLAIERFLAEALGFSLPHRLGTWASRTVTLVIVGLAWIFFRANHVRDAFTMIADLGQWHWDPRFSAALVYMAVLGSLTLFMDAALERSGDEYVLQHKRNLAPVLAVGAVFLIALFGANEANAFIYFQF